MMRWREMLMDYGQMYGEDTGKTRSMRSGGSSFFTVDGDLMAKRKADQELRRILEVHFRPLFQRFVYGGEKIACHDLRRVLKEQDYRSLLPQDKVHELVDVTDFNMGRSIKYEEFVKIVMGAPMDDIISELGSTDDDLNTEESRMVRMYRVVCRNTAQQNVVEERAETYKCLPPPVLMVLLTLVQIAVYFWYTSDTDGASIDALDGVPSNSTVDSLTYMPTRRREAWRFLTYSLLHQGFVDLLFNVLIQIVLGIPLEMTYSWWRVLIVYIVGVCCGSMGQSVFDRNVTLVGAGGGAYALLGGHMISLWQNRKRLNIDETEGGGTRLACSVTLRFVLMLLIMIPQVGLAVYRRWFLDDVSVKVGIAAYLGGLVAGFTLGPSFLLDPKLLPWQHGGSGILAFFLFLAVTGATTIFNIAFDDYPFEDYSSLSNF